MRLSRGGRAPRLFLKYDITLIASEGKLGFIESLSAAVSESGGEIYEVGGPVRDQLLGISHPKDIDLIVCGIPFPKLKDILKKQGTINLVGQTFGVIKFKPFAADFIIDISLPRKERSTGIGHRDFEIDFDHDLPIEQDLLRRDFTINAMARNMATGVLVDPYGGRNDLKERLLRMVSPSSFPDDPLRMLRGVQFAARLDLTVEGETFKAMKANAGLIKTISPERIAEELNKLLEKAEKPSMGLRLMHETGLMAEVLPELEQTVGVEQPGGYHRWDVFEHTLVAVDAAPAKLEVRLAAVFHDTGKPATREFTDTGATFYGHDRLSQQMAEKALKRLRYSNDIIKEVSLLVSRHMFSEAAGDKGIRRLINKVGKELIFDLIALRRADTVAQGMGQTTEGIDEFEKRVKAELDKSNAFGIKDLAVNGEDLKAQFKLPESKLIGEILTYLLDRVLDEPELNTYDKLLTLSADFLSKRRLDI